MCEPGCRLHTGIPMYVVDDPIHFLQAKVHANGPSTIVSIYCMYDVTKIMYIYIYWNVNYVLYVHMYVCILCVYTYIVFV